MNFFPRWIGAVTKHFALPIIFGLDAGGEFQRWEKRIAVRKAHIGGIKIASRKMCAADLIVVRLDAGVLCGLQHGDDLRLCGELKKVVVMSCVGSERLAVALE